MSQVSITPYVLTDPDGSNPRLVIPVSTPAAMVVVESRARERYTVNSAYTEGVRVALGVARKYVRAHRSRMETLYAQMDRIRESASS